MKNIVETTIETRTVERVGSMSLVRSIDFDALKAAAVDGNISTDALDGGDFVIVVTPSKRGAKASRVKVTDQAAGAAFLDGAEFVTALRKSGPRKPKAKSAAKGGKAK